HRSTHLGRRLLPDSCFSGGSLLWARLAATASFGASNWVVGSGRLKRDLAHIHAHACYEADIFRVESSEPAIRLILTNAEGPEPCPRLPHLAEPMPLRGGRENGYKRRVSCLSWRRPCSGPDPVRGRPILHGGTRLARCRGRQGRKPAGRRSGPLLVGPAVRPQPEPEPGLLVFPVV